jgi:hypothetical protein
MRQAHPTIIHLRARKRSRLEVVWSRPRAILFQVLDMGSIGWPSKRILFSGPYAIHGFFDMDPPHRRHDNVLLALGDSGCGWAKQEVQLNQGLANAPFGGSAHFGKIKEAAAEFFDLYGPESEEFMAFYPRIALHLHRGQLPYEYGSREHIARILLLCVLLLSCTKHLPPSTRCFVVCGGLLCGACSDLARLSSLAQRSGA